MLKENDRIVKIEIKEKWHDILLKWTNVIIAIVSICALIISIHNFNYSKYSDLQPAIRELNKRNIESVYLGFEMMPNKGLTATTKRTILIRNSEVLQYCQSLPL